MRDITIAHTEPDVGFAIINRSGTMNGQNSNNFNYNNNATTALIAVTNQIFPYRALETQKQWMSKYAMKPYKMGAKQFVISMSRINNYILFFPNATVLLKYSEEELLNILEFAVPPHWRKAFDLRDYLPTSDDKARFIKECERVERNKAPLAKKE
jgi:hypothetical protein